MKVIGIIPARMGSSRFPGKPLAKINNIPMLGHVFYRSKMSPFLDQVYVATCDKEIQEYINNIGGTAIMTKKTHERCTDRTVEALTKIENITGSKVDIVVMIQGDEPMITPQILNDSIQPILRDNSIQVLNLMTPLKTRKEHNDPNEIKVVVSLEGNALYFSRLAIPFWKKDTKNVPIYKQVCVIPFRRDFLLKYNKLKPTPLEVAESIDMMRILEHGYKVKMILTKTDTYAVDTPMDLDYVKNLMKNDKLLNKYPRLNH